VKYGRIYFDLFEKSAPGSSNIYSVIFKRYTITLEEYKEKSRTYEQEFPLIKELEGIYATLNENQDLIGENNRGDTTHQMIFKSLYNFYTKKRSDFQTKFQEIEDLLSEDDEQFRDRVFGKQKEGEKPGAEPIRKNLLLKKEKRGSKNYLSNYVKDKASTYEYKDLGDIYRDYYYEPKRAERNKKIDEHFSSLFGELKKYIPTFGENNKGDKYDLLHYINEKYLEDLEKDLLDKLTNYKDVAKKTVYDILTSEEQDKISKELQEKLREIWFDMEKKYGLDLTYDDEIKSKMDIYRDTYSDLANQTGENIINQVKEVRQREEYKKILQQKMPPDFFGIEPSEQAVMNLNPKYLKTIFQNGNDSLEENYRMLVTRMNSLSILMNRYFLSPTPSAKDGESLKNAAKL
jgi:hypothetical protein